MEADLREFFLAQGARIDRRRIHLQAPLAKQPTNLAA
jgi:hypothetical protein